MQLSLPISTFPAPTAPKQAAGKNSATSGTPADSPEAAAESFDSLLPKNGNFRDAAKPAPADAKKSDAETEQTAAILTAGFWMPIPPAVTPPPAPVPATTLATATSATAGPSDLIDAKGAVDAAIGAPAPAVPDNAPVAAQAAGIPFAMPGPLTGNMAQSMKRVGGTPTAISNGKTTKEGPTSTNTVASDQIAAADDALPLVPVAAGVTANAAVKSATSDVASKAISELGVGAAPDVSTKAAKDGAAITSEISPSPASAQAGQEKIAPLAPLSDQAQKFLSAVAEKYFLNPSQKAVTTAVSAVGTAVAKVSATMAATAPARSKSDSLSESTTAFVYSADQAPTATLTLDAPAPVATVHETMAAVISAVDALERRADVQQKSVDLQFNVGSEKLGLRVELRDGTVHTTFQTESSEMNSALSHEWNAVVQPALARDIHLADPVFHSAPTSGNAVPATSSDSASTAFGQGAQQQREQQKAPPVFASALKREFYDTSSPEVSPAIAPVSNSSQLLNALA
jgi:hypothetical protein